MHCEFINLKGNENRRNTLAYPEMMIVQLQKNQDKSKRFNKNKEIKADGIEINFSFDSGQQ